MVSRNGTKPCLGACAGERAKPWERTGLACLAPAERSPVKAKHARPVRSQGLLRLLRLAAVLAAVGAACLAQTQSEMNQEACRDAKKADAEMNQVYRRIMTEYRQDAPFIGKIKAAQRAWLAFRDAHLESLYPAENKQTTYGRIYPTCRCTALAAVTRRRTAELQEWVKGVREGDVCAGSVRTNR